MASQAFLAFVDRCQWVVGRLECHEIGPDDQEVVSILQSIPDVFDQPEEAAILRIVGGLTATMRSRWGTPAANVSKPRGSVSARHSQLARAALQWVEAAHSRTTLTATELAHAMGVSRWYLGRVIKKQTGKS